MVLCCWVASRTHPTKNHRVYQDLLVVVVGAHAALSVCIWRDARQQIIVEVNIAVRVAVDPCRAREAGPVDVPACRIA